MAEGLDDGATAAESAYQALKNWAEQQQIEAEENDAKDDTLLLSNVEYLQQLYSNHNQHRKRDREIPYFDADDDIEGFGDAHEEEQDDMSRIEAPTMLS